MHTHTLQDESESFQVSVREAKEFSPVVLFAVGAGGNPERHVTLLDMLKKQGAPSLLHTFNDSVRWNPQQQS